MKKRIVVIGFDTDYGVMEISCLHHIYDVKHILTPKYFISFLIFVHGRSKWLFKFICQIYFKFKMRSIQGESILVCDDSVISIETLHFDHEFITRKILIFRNTYQPDFIELNLKDIEYYSFDIGDCNKYGFLQYNQYCSGFDYINKKKGEKRNKSIDFYFLGLDKGRRNILNLLEKKLSSYTKKIVIKERPTGFKKLSSRIFKEDKYQYVDYCSHLDNILACNVVIDIVKDGQVGLTMRAVEALVAGKKIITNNKNIKNEPFYNARNIMIINEDVNINSVEIDCFLNKPVVDVDNSVLNKYSVSNIFQLILN